MIIVTLHRSHQLRSALFINGSDIANNNRLLLRFINNNNARIIIQFRGLRTLFLLIIFFGLYRTGGTQQVNTLVVKAIFRTSQAALPIAIYRIHVGTGGQQQLYNLRKIEFCRHHQAGLTILVCSIHVSSGGKQRSDIVRMVPPRRIHQTCPAVLINGVHIRAGGQQHLYDFRRRIC